MAIFLVRHITTYRYRRAVRLGRHQLMARPRDSFDQRLIDFSLNVTPEPSEVRWLHDVFGNCVAQVEFGCDSDNLRFECVIKVDHTPENAPDFRIEDHAKDHPFAYQAEEAPDLAPYVQRWFSDPEDHLGRWLDTFLVRGTRRSTGQVLMTLNEAISDGFAYDRRTAPGTQSPSTTLERRKGTCRDFAVLMIEAARSLGFAARFVTGYIYVPDRDGPVWLGGGATHAWCQIYVPGSGWVEFDPTNGIVGNRDLIRVAVARVPSQAIPLFGTYWGAREDELGMDVDVNVKTASAPS
ncbi:transglutaminase family protein [Bradyrhizobium yuanmingense]|uniref:transglutaminase family protein n=1 Tax=Bradyrhizobium yuanmingense TaxID=108015 RepID=UPI0004B9BD46|nr:transglutaminase family protein [Bradyrhizobium yuanmingense]